MNMTTVQELDAQHEAEVKAKHDMQDWLAVQGAVYSLNYIKATDNSPSTALHALNAVRALIARGNYSHTPYAVTALEHLDDAINLLDIS